MSYYEPYGYGYGYGYDYYRERRAVSKPRKLHMARVNMGPDEAQKVVSAITPDAVLKTVLLAGQEALRCSGPGWFPMSDVRVAFASGKPLILKLAGFKRIEIQVNPGTYPKGCADVAARTTSGNPLTVMENTAGAPVLLFAGYYAICPWDGWRHRQLVREAIWGAYGVDWVPRREELLAANVAMFFERSVVSHALTEVEGQMFVEGLECERAVNNVPHNLLDALFRRSQSILFREAWSGVEAIRAHSPDLVADAILPKVLKLVFGGRTRTNRRGQLVVVGKTSRPRPSEWPRRVAELARLLVPYLEQQPEDGDETPGTNPFALPSGGQAPSGIVDPDVNPNPFDLPSGPAPPGLIDSNVGSNPADPRTLPGGPLPGTGTTGSPRYNNYEAIDKYYSERASALVVRDKTDEGPKEEPEMIVVGFIGTEEASLFDIVGSRMAWSRTRICQPGDDRPLGLRLAKWDMPIEVRAGADEPEPVGVPHLMFVVDSSGSMTFNPRASGSARGKYDVVLTAAWNVMRFIQECDHAHDISIQALNFSRKTLSSGWHACTNLEPAKRALAVYQGGGTTLNIAELRHAHDTSPGDFLAIVITDGQIGNTPAVLNAFGELVRADNRLVMLHIGQANAFTKGIEKLGCPVHLLSTAEDLVGLCIGLARDTYSTSRDLETRT